ncbi:repeat protein [Anaerococcus vaginalis ATCC 51170]|uniref:Repeat protein n=2 Tax=Anaerococcus vaginalis TaxID=33037 RepID=C7HRW0_9FIRM|nr:repeat protein [Anaerococcus vaginalis ATCC 51170]
MLMKKRRIMRRENKNPRKILFSVLIAIAFVVLAGIKLGYANIISPKQGINEYHFYNDTIENKESAKEIQKQIILDGKSISDPGHVFKDKSNVLEKWQDEEGNDIKFDTPIEVKGNDKKIINVYPVFKNQVVITYYIAGSTNDRVYMTDTISDASSYKLPVDPTIYDANKYFVNWSTSKDGKSGVYDEESLKKDIAAGKTDIKLYAITEFKHKATFITGDDASYQDQILADDGGKLDKMPEDPTRAGYEFSHWSLAEDGDPVDLNTLVLDKDINVYAVWKPVVVDYKFKVMVQNINDDGYTFHEIISARGLNGEKTSLPFKGSENPDPKVAPSGPIVEDIAKLTEKDGRFNDGYNSKDSNGKMDHTYTNPQTLDYLGFHLNEEKTKEAFETIAADGSTVVPVYMDRNVHTIWVYKNANSISYYQPNWVNATDQNGNIHVDLRYGQSSDEWFDQLNEDYIYYKDKSIGSFYTKAPVMGDEDVYMYRVLAKGRKYQLRFVEWDPSKFNAQINSGSLDQLKATLGTMKEIDERVSFQNTEWYMNWNGRKYRVYEPYNNNYQQVTYSWVDKTDHVDDIEGFQPKKGDMSSDGLQSINVNNPAFRDYMFAAGNNVGGYQNYTGTKYIDDDGSYVGFLFYERKTYHINYYSGSKRLASNPYKYEADTSDFGLDYKVGETTNSKGQVFQGWYEDSTFSVEHKHEAGTKMPAHDITVYAKWDSRQYEVTFHTNQDNYEKDIEKIGEIPEDDTLYDGKYKDGKVSKENFPQPVKPENATDFLGWYEKNKNGRFVKANLHKPIKNNDTHLYAKWKYDYLTLKYDLNLKDTDKVEGEAPTDSDSYIKDAKAQVQDIGKVTVNGGKKVFVGWSETKDGSSGLILPSETVLMDKNKTLYAQWKEIPDLPTTKVTYDANGGEGAQHVVEEIITNDFHKVLGNGEGEKINYTREGYVFKGWNRDKNATKAEFQKGYEVTVTSLDESTNNYIYAIWAPIINYTTDGNGQVKEGENFVDNTKEEVELKSNPKGTDTKAKEGYKFSHWTADKEITLNDGTKIAAGEKITEEQLKQAVITEPLTFKANFVKDAPNEFNVRHEFKVAKDSPVKEMPADVKKAVDAQLPEDKKAEDGKTTTPGELKNPKDVEDKTNDGVWKFEGFKDQNPDTEAVDAKVNGADVTFEGTWKFTPNKHKVTYEYVSGTEGKELPEALKAKAPKEVTGKVKGNTVTSPVPTGDDATFRDDKNKGTWTFKSYDKNEVEITNKDENVKGTWEFTPDPEPGKYNVTHKFVSKDPNKKLPKEVLDLLPANQTGKVKGDEVKPTEPKTKTVEVKDGTWKFVSYDKDSKTVEDKDVEFTGTWEFTPKTTPTDYKVTHEFKVSEDSPIKEMPAEVKKAVDSQLPEDKKAEDGKTTTPGELKDPKDVEDKTNDGVWKFEGFKDQDPDTKDVDAKVNGADVKFEGEWKFTPNEHKVTYKFESEDPTKPLPDEVKNLLPNPEKGKVKGDKVTPTKPVPESITTKDGVWTFVGYDEESKTVGDKDVEFIGKWKFSPKPDPVTYNVNHQFKSATKGKDLPQAVKDQLPDQQTGIEDGKTVTPTSPKKEKVEDTDNDGTWTFKGYKDLDTTTDDVDAKVDGADVMFEGSWEFTPNKHKVTYEYVSGTKGVDLPEELKAKAPKEVTGKVKGDKVTSPVPEGKDAEFRDDKNKGTWTFKSFDKNSVEISNQDEKVTGTWVFTPDPEYKVEHKFVSSTKGKDLPKAVKDLTPKDQTGKKDGSVVKPTDPTQKEVKDTENDGVWTFEGYKDQDKTTDEVDAKVNGADVKFEGEWKFTPNEHKVTYEYVSGTKGIELPEALKAKAPKEATGKVKGDKVTSPVPTGKDAEYRDDVNKGTWKFKSYDKKDVTISDKDENVKGTWEFIPDVVTEYVDEDGNTIAPKETGTKDKKDIEGYEFVRTTTDDKGNTKHIYKKKTTPSPSVVTKFVDENGNPLAMEEKGKKDKKDIPAYEFVRTYTDKYGNIVHVYKFKQTPNPTVETRYVDTEGNQILADKVGTHDPSTIEGYQFVKTEKDEKGNTVHIYKKIAPVPKVETRYVDENGNQLLPPKEGTQNQVNIDGYDYISTNKDNNGNTIHVYKKKPTQDVETRYVDTEGNQILADKAGTHDPSTIEGYQLVRTEKDEKGNTRHIYQKLAPTVKVETRYVDENGNQLLLPKEGTQNQVNIEGYDYVSTSKDNNGNTIHVYKKKVLTPDVVTKYVDENGNEIADTQKGKHPSKNIEGYEIITTKSDEKGNIIYVYRKKPDPTKVVTKFVDEKGNPIAKSEDGKKPKKDIKGYEFVKTETDKDGNTIHIYKKKENTSKVVTKYVDENGKTIAPNEDGKKSKKDIKGYEFVRTETDDKGNTKHIYKKKSSSAENKYKVTHKFESSTPGKSLPKEILDLLPKNQDGIENGRKVSPTKPSKLEVKVKDGTWVFEGYDKDSSVVNNKDVNFTGKWKFVPNKIGKIKVSTGANSRSKSNVKTGIEGSSNLIFVLIGSAFALYKNKKNKY